MGRNKDTVRQYFKTVNNSEKRFSCKFCSKEYNLNVCKMKNHLNKCIRCPKNVLNHINKNTKKSCNQVVEEEDINTSSPSTQYNGSTVLNFLDKLDKVENVSIVLQS